MNDTTRDEPMAGLAEWLLFTSHNMTKDPRDREQLRAWAAEVESRRAACSSLPDGPVVNEVGVRVDASPDALRAVADQVAEVFGPARRGAEKAALIRNAAFLLGRVSLPDGGAAERAAKVQAAVDALTRLIGPPDDPNLGWRSAKGTDTLFGCEFCHALHEDCSQIQHDAKCPIPAAAPALAVLRNALKGQP